MIGPGDEGNPENMQVTETDVATKMSGSHYLSQVERCLSVDVQCFG